MHLIFWNVLPLIKYISVFEICVISFIYILYLFSNTYYFIMNSNISSNLSQYILTFIYPYIIYQSVIFHLISYHLLAICHPFISHLPIIFMCLWSGVTYPFNYISVNQAITIILSFFLHFYTYLSTCQPIYHMTKQWLYINISKIQSTVIPYFSVLLSHNLHGTMSIYLSRNTAHYFLIYPFYNPLSQISSWKYFFLANTVGLL